MSDVRPSSRRPNRNALIIGGIAVAGLVYWAYKRSAAKAASTSATDPNIDPTTGVPYASEQYSSAGAVGTTPSLYGYIDPTTGQFIGGTSTTSVVTAPSSNSQWMQQAAAYLISQGFDPITTLTALGRYISGQGLSDTEMGIVQAAKAEGEPPQSVPPAHIAPPTGQSSVGLSAPQLAVESVRGTSVRLYWTPVAGATEYHLHKGIIPVAGIRAPSTRFTVPRHSGAYTVMAFGGGKNSAESNRVTV